MIGEYMGTSPEGFADWLAWAAGEVDEDIPFEEDDQLEEDPLEDVKAYLETSYSGARMLDDAESMIRISRALACLYSDPEEDIFSNEFSEK